MRYLLSRSFLALQFLTIVVCTRAGMMMGANLYNAACEGRVRDVTQLLRAGADVNFAAPTHGTTALMLSSQRGHLDVAAALIKAGAEVIKADMRFLLSRSFLALQFQNITM